MQHSRRFGWLYPRQMRIPTPKWLAACVPNLTFACAKSVFLYCLFFLQLGDKYIHNYNQLNNHYYYHIHKMIKIIIIQGGLKCFPQEQVEM